VRNFRRRSFSHRTFLIFSQRDILCAGAKLGVLLLKGNYR
jgi:hypothetical protein